MSRIQNLERDRSGFTNTLMNETGAMVIRSAKGKSTPMYLQSEEDCLRELGTPSATYPGVFEAIAFTRTAPLWCATAYATDAVYGGIDVSLTEYTGFGIGRDYSSFNYGTVVKSTVYTHSAASGTLATFTGSLAYIPVVETDSFTTYVDGVAKTVTLSAGGVLSGADVTSGSVDLTTGDFTITFGGVVGTVASVTTTVDGSSNYDLSLGATDKSIRISVDGTIQEVNLGQSAATTRAGVISAINTAFGYTVAATSGSNYIAIYGGRGTTTASVSVSAPLSGDSALTLVFSNTGLALTGTGTNPTGSVPLYNQVVTFGYHYSVNGTTTISHSFFTTSPYIDDLAAVVTYVSGKKFVLSLYKLNASGYVPIQTYNYSLIQEKDGAGKSLYYADVFNANPYVQFKLNSAFTDTAYSIASTAVTPFTGGTRGTTAPLASDYTTAWGYFQYANKYRAKIFMDVYGTNAVLLNTIVQTYQPWAQAITCIPLGYTAAQGLSFRSNLGIDSDDICLYHNWRKIDDTYNNSMAWISNVGSIGRKFAMMADSYDAASPAGVDENSHGGLISDWATLEVELDFTQAELDSYYNAQINPIIFDDAYGLMLYGDNTMQVTTSDTSFVGTRRVYKYITDTISTQILRKQEFKLNDPIHRLMAKTQVDEFLAPIIGEGWIREALTVCDSSNNTDAVLNARQFIFDLYIKITPNSQWITLRLTRVGQSVNIADLTA